jgi:ABC-type amino acid transport substrate-binding protein
VRALVIGALALSLIGCSHSLPPQPAVVACAGVSASSCAVGQPPQPMWLKAPSAAMQAMPARLAKIEEPSPIYVRDRVRLADRLAGKNDTSDKPAASAKPVHVPLPRIAPRIAGGVAAAQASVADQPTAEAKPVVEAKPAASEPKAIQQQVAVASATEPGAVAAAPPQKKEPINRIEAARPGEAAKTVPLPPENPDLLVAVLMARPDTKSVSDLAGKIIAIDDRYAKSSGTVRTAIVAAGAPEVQLSEGQTTAMNRLTNGEVPAAVVALLSPEGADAFPEIKGFKIFHVPLSPRAARAKP